MATKGWDSFHYLSGAVKEKVCLVCGRKCAEQRNVDEAASYAESMSGGHHVHDYFVCHDTGRDWHIQALGLKQEAAKTNSKTFADSLLAEAEAVLQDRTCTKTSGTTP